jgi:hypothetical protein
MTPTLTRDLTPGNAKWPALDRDPADTTRRARGDQSSHAAERRKTSPSAYDDPTQGRKVGSDPYDDPTQGRKIGSDPYDDPTRAG